MADNGLTVYGKTVQSSVDFADNYYYSQPATDANGFRLHNGGGVPDPTATAPGANGLGRHHGGEPRRQVKPIKVHSPKVRTGWQREAVMANYEKSRTSNVKDNFDYSPANAYHEEKRQPRGGAYDSRFTEIQQRHANTEVSKVMNPGKERFCQQEFNPKCPTADSKEFYQRNQRGTYGFMEAPRPTYPVDDPGKVRCPSGAAKDNLEKGRGQAGRLIHQEERSRTPPPNRRCGVSQDTRENYERGHAGSMSSVMNQSANIGAKYQDAASAGRVIKGEAAEANMQRNKGQTLHLFGGGGGGGGGGQQEPQPAPRVRPEARETAAREGAGMRGTFLGGPQADPQPAQRVRLAGSDVAGRLQQGTLTKEQYNYRQMPQEPQPAPKVRPEAEEYAKRERAIATKNLLQMYGRLPSDMPPKPHVPPQAWNTAYRSRGGAMRDCINPSTRPRSRRRRRPVSAH